MPKRGSSTYIVGLKQGTIDLRELQSGVLHIKGVSRVEFNYMTRKLTIAYDGAQSTLDRINERLSGHVRIRR